MMKQNPEYKMDQADHEKLQRELIEKSVVLEGRIALDCRAHVPERPLLHANDVVRNCTMLEAHCASMETMLEYRRKHPSPIASFEKLHAQGTTPAPKAADAPPPKSTTEKLIASKAAAPEPSKTESNLTLTERCMAARNRPATGAMPAAVSGISRRCQDFKTTGVMPKDAPKPLTASQKCAAAKAEQTVTE